jgi:uridine kinase
MMPTPPPDATFLHATAAVRRFIAAAALDRSAPLVVALDGRSGAGKSTIARAVAADLVAAVVPLDDFFAASVPSGRWDAWTPAERAANVIEWTRVREDALVPLRAGRAARWWPFDFAAGMQADGSWLRQRDPVVVHPRPIVLLDGAYAGSPALADLVDLTILIEAPASEREARLRAREEAAFLAQWHRRWDAVEEHYATTVRPRGSYQLVISMGERDP